MRPETEAAVLRMLSPGRGILAIHSGLFFLQANPGFDRITGGRFLNHPEHCVLRYHMRSCAVTEGVEDFEMDEEPYRFSFCMDATRNDMVEYSHEGRNWPAAWTTEASGGRFAYLSMGHELRSFMQSGFRQLISHAAAWITGV